MSLRRLFGNTVRVCVVCLPLLTRVSWPAEDYRSHVAWTGDALSLVHCAAEQYARRHAVHARARRTAAESIAQVAAQAALVWSRYRWWDWCFILLGAHC